MMTTNSVLKVAGLKKQFKSRQVVKDVTLDIQSGEVIGLLGPNGAGKTTSFYMIVGIIAADDGSIVLDGQEMRHLPIHERAQKGVGYLPQEASIFRKMTVTENIQAILEINTQDKAEITKQTERLLDDLNIGHIKDSPAVALSAVNAVAWKLLEYWQPNRVLFYWTNRLQVLTRLLSLIFKISFLI